MTQERFHELIHVVLDRLGAAAPPHELFAGGVEDWHARARLAHFLAQTEEYHAEALELFLSVVDAEPNEELAQDVEEKVYAMQGLSALEAADKATQEAALEHINLAIECAESTDFLYKYILRGELWADRWNLMHKLRMTEEAEAEADERIAAFDGFDAVIGAVEADAGGQQVPQVGLLPGTRRVAELGGVLPPVNGAQDEVAGAEPAGALLVRGVHPVAGAGVGQLEAGVAPLTGHVPDVEQVRQRPPVVNGDDVGILAQDRGELEAGRPTGVPAPTGLSRGATDRDRGRLVAPDPLLPRGQLGAVEDPGPPRALLPGLHEVDGGGVPDPLPAGVGQGRLGVPPEDGAHGDHVEHVQEPLDLAVRPVGMSSQGTCPHDGGGFTARSTRWPGVSTASSREARKPGGTRTWARSRMSSSSRSGSPARAPSTTRRKCPTSSGSGVAVEAVSSSSSSSKKRAISSSSSSGPVPTSGWAGRGG